LERDIPECRMDSSEIELRFVQLPSLELCEVFLAQLSELIEERDHCAPFVARVMPKAIVGLEGLVFRAGEDDSRSRHPVGFFAVDEMADYIERVECVPAFVAPSERVGKVAEQRVDCCGCSSQYVDRGVEIKSHDC